MTSAPDHGGAVPDHGGVASDLGGVAPDHGGIESDHGGIESGHGGIEPGQADPVPGRGASGAPGRDVALRHTGSGVIARQSLARGVAALRRNLPELARHPAVVATASVTATLGARLAARAVSQLLAGGARPATAVTRADGPAGPAVAGVFVGHVDVVVHHVLHRVDRP